jgi:hypothetical protein
LRLFALFLFKVNIVGNPGSSCSCGNDWTSWLETRDNATKPMRNSQSSIQYPSEFIRRCQTLPVRYWKVEGRHLKIPFYTDVASHIFSWPILGVLNGSLNVIELRLCVSRERTISVFMGGEDSSLYRSFCVRGKHFGILSLRQLRWPLRDSCSNGSFEATGRAGFVFTAGQ